MQQAGVWRNRQPAMQAALKRLSEAALARGERLCLAIDGAAKGFAPGDPWQTLDQLLLLLATGHTAPNGTALRRTGS
jgi:DNA polymerase-3 subunit delta